MYIRKRLSHSLSRPAVILHTVPDILYVVLRDFLEDVEFKKNSQFATTMY